MMHPRSTRRPGATVLVLAFSMVLLRAHLGAQEERGRVILSGGRGQATQATPTPMPTPHPTPTPQLTVSDMRGAWTAALSGVTGCGTATEHYEFTLDASGSGTQSLNSSHTVGCGDFDQPGLYVDLQVLNPDGSGFIAFGCGPGCGFGFFIQVSRNREMFSMSPEEVGGNYLAGVAIRK
jgi:hypothetical protein